MAIQQRETPRYRQRRAPLARLSLALGFVLVALTSAGCIVPQPHGGGKLARIVEPTTNRGYWLYLSKPYVEADDTARAARRWPLVVSFHGMKPFDNAHPQALEWQQEADRYGFVVIAPELRAPDVLGQFPLRTVTSALKGDENTTMAILSHVFATTRADPTNVLATGWSSGGYMAHYMLNRHPERFTCLGVRQSNFSASVLDPDAARRGLDHPIFIVNTKNDFAICKKESAEGVRWYESNGYRNVGWIVINTLGHERTPDIAAAFFARVAKVEPIGPATVLARRQAIDGNQAGIAMLSGHADFSQHTAGRSFASNARPATARDLPPETAQRSRPIARRTTTPSQTVQRRTPPPSTPPRPENATNSLMVRHPRSAVANEATPTRTAAIPTRAPLRSPVSIRVSSAIGIEPLHLGFSAECPTGWRSSADFLWTLNGENIAGGVNGQKTLSTAGVHTLELLVVTDAGETYRTQRTIRVLPRLSNATSVNAASP